MNLTLSSVQPLVAVLLNWTLPLHPRGFHLVQHMALPDTTGYRHHLIAGNRQVQLFPAAQHRVVGLPWLSLGTNIPIHA
jgi:hypothetical protein